MTLRDTPAWVVCIIFFAVLFAFFQLTMPYRHATKPVTGADCVEVINRVFEKQQKRMDVTKLEQEDLDRCDMKRPPGRYE